LPSGRKAALYVAERGSVATWIFTIARNLRIDRLRREKSNQFTDLDDYDAPSDDPGQDEALHRLQEDSAVALALAQIPSEQRELLILSYVEDLPQSEIAARLQIPLGTVKSRMRLAYRRLKKLSGDSDVKITHHLDDATLVAYAAGTLGEAHRVVVAAHAAICGECRAAIRAAERVGGMLLDDHEANAVSDTCRAATLASLDGVTRPAVQRRFLLAMCRCRWLRCWETADWQTLQMEEQGARHCQG
jgi:predicted RNA polymerase sigma factor